jgi:hypothetical protein
LFASEFEDFRAISEDSDIKPFAASLSCFWLVFPFPYLQVSSKHIERSKITLGLHFLL